jgi:hypothetical protein
MNPEVVGETDKETLGKNAAKVIDKLEEMGYIPKATQIKGEPTPGRRRGSSKSG